MPIRSESHGTVAGYSPDQDDRYAFNQAHSIPARLRGNPATLDITAIPPSCRSALLKLRVRSTRTLHFGFPTVCIGSGSRTFASFALDRGTRGIRYLDVSALLDDPRPSAPRVHCKGAKLEPDVELLLFDGVVPAKSTRLLVIAPHPDDAEIAAFGLYKHCTSAVVTITGGESGGSNYARLHHDKREQQRLKSRMRVWDSLAVPLLAGVSAPHVANLGYFDGTLKSMYSTPSKAVVSTATGFTSVDAQRRALDPLLLRPDALPTWDSLVADLRHVLDRFRPDVIVAPHPFLDAHPDHRYTTVALIDALQSCRSTASRALLYVNHPVYCTRWPFGPPWLSQSLPPMPNRLPSLPRFYSHALTEQDLTEKSFALEAMHDLRRGPYALRSRMEWSPLGAALKARGAVRQHFSDAMKLMRRALRPREIFFDYPASELAALRSAGASAETLWSSQSTDG